MGTRGFYAFVFRGRFYIYYNHWDSYPAVLGKIIVDKIPQDSNDYKEWLDALRAFFVPYDEELNNKLLVYDDDGIRDPQAWETSLQEALKLPPPPGYCPPPIEYPAEVLTTIEICRPEPNVEHLPSATTYPDNDLFIEWIYIIDLDRQVFHVRSDGAWRFALDRVPHGAEWKGHNWNRRDDGPDGNDGLAEVSATSPQPEDEPSSASAGDGPVVAGGAAAAEAVAEAEGVETIAKVTPSDGGDSVVGSRTALTDDASRARQLIVHLSGAVRAYFRIDKSDDMTAAVESQPVLNASHVVRKLLFWRFLSQHNGVIANHIADYTPDDAVYREFAFAMLSLAAGEVSLLAADNDRIVPREPQVLCVYQPKAADRCVLPTFGHGVHMTGFAAGSAPLGAKTYWLGNVVVCLVDDNAMRAASGLDGEYEGLDPYETAIADAIKFVWQSGSGRRSAFYGLLFSLSRVVCFRVTPSAAGSAKGGNDSNDGSGSGDGVVEYSGPLTLLTLEGTLQPGYHATHPKAGAALAALMHHFDAAAGQPRVHGRGEDDGAADAAVTEAANAGVLPDELLQHVMHHADWLTWRALARTKTSCARYALSRVRLDVPGRVLVIKHVRPVVWVHGPAKDKGYELLEHVDRDGAAVGSSGSGSGSGPSTDGLPKGHTDQDGAGKAWLLMRNVLQKCLYDGQRNGVVVAHFRPVIGEGARRSLLTETVCLLVRVPKDELIARKAEDDDEGLLDVGY